MSAARRLALLGLLLAAGGEPRPSRVQGFDPGPVPGELAAGERAYDRTCRPCHGPLGTGTEAGPPLVHRIYEPGHHADAAFHLAVRHGVRAPHWSFGNMPPISRSQLATVAGVTAYVRWLQRSAGIR